MKKKGLADSTIQNRTYLLKTLTKKGADLENPETVETILATENFTPPYKKAFTNAYKAYTIFKEIKWNKPRVIVPDKEPFLPNEQEINELIAGAGKQTSALLQLLKETGIRIGEASQLKWTNINYQTKTISINCPEKGSNARTLKLSDNLIARLNALQKRQDNNIFNPNKKTLDSTFERARKKVSEHLQNPRIKQIHFHTLRHLKATTEYYKTGGDILRVKYILGHKSLNSTSKYAHYQAFKTDEYTCKTAINAKEATNLIENGFQYVTTTPNELMLFRKRK